MTPWVHRWRSGAWVLVLALGSSLASLSSAAGLPSAYGAVVLSPGGGPERTEFDLTPVRDRARQENKRLYVYLGASDCRYCRQYEAFLEKNARELVPRFAAKYILVDLRSSLSVPASRLYFRVGGSVWPYVEFQRSIGDERSRLLVYPTVWLFDADLRPLMQMPSGAGTFQTVQEQIEVLDLVQ